MLYGVVQGAGAAFGVYDSVSFWVGSWEGVMEPA